ncbi:MAG: hypothetical protein ABI442_07230 [Gemmatimonadaceae bacterium]
MFIPLVDQLRCPNAHADTWLVASIDRAIDRDLITGILGCPQCLAEYPVRDGIVYFSETPRAPFEAPVENEAIRIAAALDLTDARMTAVLHGRWGAHAPVIQGMSPAALLLVNPPEGIVSGDGISIVIADTAPVAVGSMNAVALDGAANAEMISSLCAALRGGGRILGPSTMALPADLVELARDDEVWVARQDAAPASGPIPITRRAR